MTFAEYIPKAMKTAMYKSKEMQITCGAYGLIGEYVEFQEKLDMESLPDNLEDVVKELGDFAWYLASLSNAFNIVPRDVLLFQTINVRYFGSFMELLKKLYRKYDYFGPEELMKKMYTYIDSAYVFFLESVLMINDILRDYGEKSITTGEVLQYNLDKLADRKERGVLHSEGDNR